jgi:hypothetical protein
VASETQDAGLRTADMARGQSRGDLRFSSWEGRGSRTVGVDRARSDVRKHRPRAAANAR